MSITLPGYYDRFDPTQEFERHLFRAGNVIQSAEFNEVQSASMHRLKGVADALFVDGDILKNAGLSFNPNTGLCVCDAGEVYVNGAVRSVGATTLTLPTTGTVLVGVRLIDTVITEAEDASLLDPACEMPNRREPGAARLKAHLEWGWNGDGKGEMTAVYVIIDGEIQAKVNGSHHHAISHIAGLQESLDAITVALTGDVTGESGVDDDGLISIMATVADNSHNHVIDNIDGLDVLTEGGVTSENPSGFSSS
ncbi:MAG: DUF4815 domain-containing protein [Chromatiales bacterium]|nr:DUF4815 domain-containing protein [Chromatiales bacterium]